MKADTCIVIIIGNTGVNVTSGKFTAADVIETGGKFPKVSATSVANVLKIRRFTTG
jgi:hypothetical protein